MKPLHKKRNLLWLKALLSGEFKQGSLRLRNDDSYCCLGVACEVYRRETHKGRWRDKRHFMGATTITPAPVARWFGWKLQNPFVTKRFQAIAVNDSGNYDFRRIARAFAKLHGIKLPTKRKVKAPARKPRKRAVSK